MISKKFNFLLIFTLGILLLSVPLNAESKDKNSGSSLAKTTGNPIRAFLDINNILSVFKNDGISDIDKDEKNSGVVYPKGSGKTAVYMSGFLWGCYVGSDPQVRVGGSAYRSSMKAGKILPSGIAEDPALPKNRIYRVRPDVYPGGPAVDLSMEASNEASSTAAVRSQYELDWSEWPATDGAPFTDKNGNGVYEPGIDVPGVPGADQTIWYVANDANATQSVYLYGTNPCNVELQVTIWAYSQTGALGNMFFRKYKMINKSQNALRDVYVSMWSDVDLGNSSDDFSGCDTLLSLGYCYNANATDATYNPLPPPAVGFDFFQGPFLKGVAGEDLNKNGVDDALDYGAKNGKTFGPGYINLPMTAFYYFARGDASVTDPTQGDPQGATQFYNFFQGKIGLTGKPFVDPNTGKNTPYVMPGDPVTKTGWIDGQLLSAGDRRQGQASGPFQMAVGDTQEIVVAEIIAGAIPGMDNLSAISLLKFYDTQAQLTYDNFFNLPPAPPVPQVIATELDKEIVLDWGEDLAKVNATENFDQQTYKFQGYNVYQLPSASASRAEGKLLATFDIVDGVKRIVDRDFDASSGVILDVVKQFGTDSGIQRFLDIKDDKIKNTPLVNGLKYYFAVTSYAYSTDPSKIPNNTENPMAIITIVPHSPNPGVRYPQQAGDTIKVSHSKGNSNGNVLPIVVDPSKLTGDTYKVVFDTLHGEVVWSLYDVTKGNKLLLANQSNQSGDVNYQTTDGIIVKPIGPKPGMNSGGEGEGWSIPSGTRRWTFNTADGFAMEGFSGAIGNGLDVWGVGVPYAELKNVLLKFANTSGTGDADVNDPNCSFAYRYMRGCQSAPAKPEFTPFIINKGASYDFQDFKKGFPFAAYVDEPGQPQRRLAVGFLENNSANGLVDGKYWPAFYNDLAAAGSDNTATSGPREWFFIFDADYSETVNPALAVNFANDETPLMWLGTPNRRQDNTVAWSNTDQFKIFANHINTVGDEFTFTAPAASTDAKLAKDDLNKINVFPNPYYGVNSEEINKYNRFVTFNHLPANVKVKIFNLAGVLVKNIEKADPSQYLRWDLANNSGLPVASGLYLAYIELPDFGVTKILKIAVIQEQQILDRF
jgi:hypothetical protein